MSETFSKSYRINLIKNGKKPLSETHPEIAKEWDLDKNLDEKPDFFTSGSNQKVWWQCKLGHEWESTIKNNTSKRAHHLGR